MRAKDAAAPLALEIEHAARESAPDVARQVRLAVEQATAEAMERERALTARVAELERERDEAFAAGKLAMRDAIGAVHGRA